MPTHDGPWQDGYPCWVDLSSTDREASWAFYTEVMGWQIRDTGPDMGHYGIAMVDGRSVGAIGQAMAGQPTAWATYFASSDCDAASRRVADAGGMVVLPAGDVGPAGRLSICADPLGGVFGIWQGGSNLGVGLVAEPGAPVWFDHMTRDPEVARDFYAAVFGWTYTVMEDGHDYQTVDGADPAAPICGIGHIGDVPDEVPSHWRAYFAVGDADATVELAAARGGQITMQPWDTPYGRMFIVADPQGGTFVGLGPVRDDTA
jgi:predicted enzyme related to lactoylglutathione lyase